MRQKAPPRRLGSGAAPAPPAKRACRRTAPLSLPLRVLRPDSVSLASLPLQLDAPIDPAAARFLAADDDGAAVLLDAAAERLAGVALADGALAALASLHASLHAASPPLLAFSLVLEEGGARLRLSAPRFALEEGLLFLRPQLLRLLLPPDAAGGGSFSVAALYRALRPPADAPALLPPTPQLLPQLKSWQRAAAAWMRRREAGEEEEEEEEEGEPLGWRRLGQAWVCEASGFMQLRPPPPPPPVRGGLLADEMGLGKTVTLLKLICANRWEAPAAPAVAAAAAEPPPRPDWAGERTECACGREEPPGKGGTASWVQCGSCDGWSHCACVGYSARAAARSAAAEPAAAAAQPAAAAAEPAIDAAEAAVAAPPREPSVASAAPAARRRRAPAAAAPPFLCRRCAAWLAGRRLAGGCGATLIVVPPTILGQWTAEIQRHTRPGSLSLLLYSGQAQGGCAAGPPYTAAQLAAADVVLTSYDVLRAELWRDGDIAPGRTRAGGARYQVLPSPLTRLTWWRLVLDEAQLVEGGGTAAAEMAGRLSAEHRWAVSGSPLERGAEDLGGLFSFLRAQPLADAAAWRAAVTRKLAEGRGAEVQATLAAALRPLMWRSSRAQLEADAAAELGLRPQAMLLTRLRATPLERHWYSQQRESVAEEAAKALATAVRGRAEAEADDPLPPHAARAALRPLLRLRQACDNPQVGAGGLAAAVAGAPVMTMSDVAARLVERARLAAEEAMRASAMDYNARAGLALALPAAGGAARAAQLYRYVAALEADGARDATPPLRLDLLQRLHYRTGLAAALRIAGEAERAAAAAAEAEAATLRDEYLAPRCASFAAAEAERVRAAAAAPGHAAGGGWFAQLCSAAARGADGGAALLRRVDEATQGRWQGGRPAHRDAPGLSLILVSDLDAIRHASRAMQAACARTAAATSAAAPATVSASGRCGACRGPQGDPAVRCLHCAAAPAFEAAEEALFGRTEADVGAGRSAPSSAELALRAISTWGRAHLPGGWEAAAKAELEGLEAARRAYARAAASDSAQRELLGARDELDMAATRLRLRTAAEMPGPGRPDPVPRLLRASVLHEAEAEALLDELQQNAQAREAELARARAQLRWLQRQGGSGGRSGDDCCPVCHDALEQRAVMPCGHALCAPCALKLMQRAEQRGGAQSLRCPSCRAAASPSDVSLVHEGGGGGGGGGAQTEAEGEGAARAAGLALAAALAHPVSGEATVPCVAGWGSKLDAVTRRLLWLRAHDRGAKALVFSEWVEVLRVLQAALQANGLACCAALGAGEAAARAIAAFRAPGGPAILLLPIARGGNGLTLVEASHVLLCEPLLDAGAELQAAKRVDRIGQARGTALHRFLVRGSVEERVRDLSAARAERAGAEARAGGRAPGLRPSQVAALLRDGGEGLQGGSPLSPPAGGPSS